MYQAREFSKRASSYDSYNIIQNEVAKKLVNKINGSNLKILDLGCGSGAIYKLLDEKISSFVGIDLALNMCNLHPKNDKVKIFNLSFDDESFYKQFDKCYFDVIVSSSALQWSKNRKMIYENIKRLTNKFALAIFTHETFLHLHNFCNLEAILPTKNELKNELFEIFEDKIEIEIVRYKLHFDTPKDMFTYIKKSGVSGGTKRLSYKEAKNLYENYDRDFLEFEVMFISKF